jgi:hypothetical protein
VNSLVHSCEFQETSNREKIKKTSYVYVLLLIFMTCGLVTMWRATTSASAMSSTPDGRINVAAAQNGGIATPSSTKDDNYPASAVFDGDRTGSGWGEGVAGLTVRPVSYPIRL